MNVSTKEKTEKRSRELKSLDFKKAKRRKGPSGGIFYRLTEPIRDWHQLPQTIRESVPQAHRNMVRIDDALIDYRLALTKTVHVAKHVNQKIWESYQSVKRQIRLLSIETNKGSLRFHTNKYYRSLLDQWNRLIADQNELLDEISRAPASLKFYNMMVTYKEIRQQERLDDEQNEKRYQEAYNSLEAALDYAESYIRNKDNEFFSASRVLSLDDARQSWSDRLVEINELQKSGKAKIDDIIDSINTLKNIIFEAPPIAKWIFDVEQRYYHLLDDHKLLHNMYGKSVIHEEELDETNILMTEMVPKLWVSGDNEQLEHYLHQIETFLKNYETPIQEELAYQERHSPWAKFGEDANEDEITMLTSFVRIMINAIESRESHMGDHSGTVARLARSTAKQLKWSEQELNLLEIAGLMHDVGKIWIPESLLTKPGPLTENEFEVLRLHPFYSAKIVESISALKDIVPWVYYHHERWDGKGYPESLKRDEIPLGASIIAVAEAFSAMIFNTLSRKPLTIDEAYSQIREESGKQFDPDVTDAFITAASSMRSELETMQEKGFTSPI